MGKVASDQNLLARFGLSEPLPEVVFGLFQRHRHGLNLLKRAQNSRLFTRGKGA
jgi:hypothetical protein